jgi:hypothetical protein
MFRPPIGFVTLFEAVDAVGVAVFGSSWQYAMTLDHAADKESDPHERVITMVAKACEAGIIEAGYPTPPGTVDALHRSEWQKPHWHNYFANGMIDLHDLPLLDDRFRPVPDGRTAPLCTRKIFIREDSLSEFVKTLATEEPKLELASGHYGSDGPLLEEMELLIASGMTMTKASHQLANRAEGATLDSRARRLREKFKVRREV